MSYTTNRTDSVLGKGFLCPLHLNEDGIPFESQEEKEEGQRKKPSVPKRRLFGRNLKKKIGPMETDKVSAKEQPPANSFEANPNSQRVISLDICDESGPEVRKNDIFGQDYEMLPTVTELSSKMNPIELEALKILANLGISKEMLLQASSSGARNELIGIYRIVVNRLQLHAIKQSGQLLKTKEENGLAVKSSSPVRRKVSSSSSRCAIL